MPHSAQRCRRRFGTRCTSTGRTHPSTKSSRAGPAARVGLPSSAVLAPGVPADLLVFYAVMIGPWRKEFVHDLPGGVGRLKAWGQGVLATVVSGTPIVRDGALTGALLGEVV